MTKAKICMDQIKWISFIVFTTVLALVIQLLIINPVIAQGPNTTSTENRNNTRLIVNLKNHTISFTLVNATTNETISVKNFPVKSAASTTTNENLTNENLTTIAGNATTNEILSPENTTTNETLTKNTGNATTSENLTAKFNELQGK